MQWQMVTDTGGIPYNETQYGFKWGAMEVTRIASDPKWWTVIEVGGNKQAYQIRVSSAGRKVTVRKVGGTETVT